MKFLFTLCLAAASLRAQSLRITTSQYDNARTGANTQEHILNPKNVNGREFGKVASLSVDGDVYAQPLYLSHVHVPGKGVRNLLFIATEHDSVYAFDADSASATPVWHVNLLPPKSTPVHDRDVQCPFISPEVGITSTPVIDTDTGTLYVLTRSKRNDALTSHYAQRLHALAVTTGREKFGGPVEIQASVPGKGQGSSGGRILFDPLHENPRAALLLNKGAVFLTWASSCDVAPYHGWIIAYEATTLHQLAVFNTSPNTGESGIWQSDTGPVADNEGYIYVSTGNGIFDAGPGSGPDYGDTLLKLHLEANQLKVTDYFTPSDHRELNSTDGDLGSGGPLLMADQPAHDADRLVFGGKAGVLYALNPRQLGGLQGTSQNTPRATFKLARGIYSAPAHWNGHLYYFADRDALKEFTVAHGDITAVPTSRSGESSKFSGGTPTISASGSQSGIVWVIETRAWNTSGNRAILRAYDALNVSRLLYASDQRPSRDQAGIALRFTIPTVANGRVYIGSKNSVDVYGLLSQ